jgi:multicomponent Na+:H+ antiporter subunit F
VKELLVVVCVFLFLNLLAGLIRVWRGPTSADSLLAVQLMGTTGAALLMVLFAIQKTAALVDAALILALLAAVTLLVFSCRIWRPGKTSEDRKVQNERL